ncbi:MAG TPA: glycine cleavage system aminomethyltransferase GcvT [Patescibacteria group bacterium]|nr:glycine cleavage system aminomethyltransferase GcvT [Patescibacteria group bacterium]
MALKTPIYEAHVARGGRIVEFAGFLMPVSFEGIVAEHERVRNAVGLFDVSHMGEIEITGRDACAFTDYIVSNNVGRLEEGQICYTVCCNDAGRVLDDLLVYKFSEERILLVVNAVNTKKIYDHVGAVLRGAVDVKSRDRLAEERKKDVAIRNVSPETAQIAVQGPNARDILRSSRICAPVRDELATIPYYRFIIFRYNGGEIVVSRTGYTGELGYEIYLPAPLALDVWNELLACGEDYGAAPIGLGARDTLRFEPAFCLYGHELDEETSPLESGLSWVVKLKKGDFIGREALAAEKDAAPSRVLIGLEIEGRGIARQGFSVLKQGTGIGTVTSGTFSPTLKKSLAMALVSRSISLDNGGITVDIRGKSVPANRVPLPFYKSRAAD